MKTVAIIQARMSSRRLPGKVLADIAGRPMLWHVISRAQRAKSLDRVVVATSDNQTDDAVACFCADSGVECFRGSEEDVLDRYYQAATRYEAEAIVRLTADCPLLEPEVMDKVALVFREGQFDYVSNTLERSYPDGLDTEVFSLAALARAWREARWRSEREHVTPYLWKHPERFRLGSVRNAQDLSSMRWTVDEPHDLEMVRAIYERWGTRPFRMAELLNYLKDHSEIAGMNARFAPNEGYQRSLREDEMIGLPGGK